MAEFKVGGKVICIESLELISGSGEKFCYDINSIYTVEEIKVCSCGRIHLWFGEYMKREHDIVCACDKMYPSTKAVAGSIFFLPLDDFKEVAFEKIKEQVPVGAQ